MHSQSRTISRFFGFIGVPMVLAMSASLTIAQSDSSKKTRPNKAFYAKIASGIKEGKTSETAMAGMGDMPFRQVWKRGGYLVGLDISYGAFAGSKLMIRSVRPIFQTAEGRKYGTLRGVPSAVSRRIVAKPGYAVGGITVSSGLNVDGLSITFLRLDGDTLQPDDSYKSAWYGSKGQREGKKLGGDGALIIGIFGRTSGLRLKDHELRGLGLIEMGEKAQPSRRRRDRNR